jgi:hypothetical protein
LVAHLKRQSDLVDTHGRRSSVCLPIAAMSLQGEEEGMHQRNGSAPWGEEEDLHQRNGSAKKGAAEKGCDG